LANPSWQTALSRRCREYAETQYSWDANVRAIEALMKRA
jgi:glycosyltransferase involved in cell wall biosynthesis